MTDKEKQTVSEVEKSTPGWFKVLMKEYYKVILAESKILEAMGKQGEK